MSKKNYSYFKEHGYRYPKIAWFFDKGLVYLVFLLAAVVGVSGILWNGASAYNNMQKTLPDNSPYKKISTKETPASVWAKEFIKNKPESEKEWSTSNNSDPRQPIEFNECNFGLIDQTVLSSFSAANKKLKLQVNIYSPGVARKDFENYKEKYSKCWELESEWTGDPRTEIITYPEGFFFTYGDVIIFVKHKIDDNQAELIKLYTDKAASSLEQYECNSLLTVTDDIKRNLYYDRKNYTGYLQREKVDTTLELGYIPTPVYPEVKTYTYMDEPEGPLPAKFPKLPKTNLTKPIINPPADNKTPNFSQIFIYQVKDYAGPGCGWKWAGMETPIVNTEKLKENRVKDRIETQRKVDKNAGDYVTKQLSTSKEALSLLVTIERWNSYINNVDKVHSKWSWLIEERNKLYDSWATYVANNDNWVNFDNIKKNAQKDYDNAVIACNAANKKVEDWEEKYSNLPEEEPVLEETPTPTPKTPDPTSTASPTSNPTGEPTETESSTSTSTKTSEPTSTTPTRSIPPRPVGCSSTPVEPYILSQEKGAKPKPPAIPEGVTIPYSWPDPITTPTVALK